MKVKNNQSVIVTIRIQKGVLSAFDKVVKASQTTRNGLIVRLIERFIRTLEV